MIVGMQSPDLLPASFDQKVQFPDLVSVEEVFRIFDLDLPVVGIPGAPALEKMSLHHDSSEGVVSNVLVTV